MSIASNPRFDSCLDADVVSAQYDSQGYAVLPPSPSGTQSLDALAGACLDVYALAKRTVSAQIERYGDGQPKIVFGAHLLEPRIAEICRGETARRLVTPVLAPEEVYLYQTKLTSSSLENGPAFPWHQDYHNWQMRDGVPTDELLNVIVFLDDVNENSGPIEAFPGSHKCGPLVSIGPALDNRTLPGRGPTAVLLGSRGTVVLMHPCLIHRSRPKRSARRRLLFFATYNAVANAPRPVRSPRHYSETDLCPLAQREPRGSNL